MSSFTPEGYVGKDALQGLNTSAPTDQAELSEYELGLVQKLFSAPNRIPASFFSYLLSYIEQANLLIPISQVAGFSQFNAQTTTVLTQETTTSSSYVDLATVGPSLTGVPAGQYIVFFGAELTSTVNGDSAIASVSVNAAAPDENNFIIATVTGTTFDISTMRAFATTLTSDSNSLKIKYKSFPGGNSVKFAKRWITAFRYANS